MLNISDLPTSMPNGPFDGVILTSANAVTSLADRTELKQLQNLPVLTTGKATTKAASAAGFSNIESNPGSALDLVDHLPEWMNRHGLEGHLLYPCAETTAHDLPAILERQRITCQAWPVYRAQPATDFTEKTKQGLRNGKFDAILLYSKRTAHTFVQLMQQNKFAMEGLRTYVMSKDIYEALPKELQDHAQYPDSPVEADLLNLIGP